MMMIGCNTEIPKNSKSSHVCGENRPIFKCEQCDYEADKKSNLQRHNKVHNQKPKPEILSSEHQALPPLKIVQILFNLLNNKIATLSSRFWLSHFPSDNFYRKMRQSAMLLHCARSRTMWSVTAVIGDTLPRSMAQVPCRTGRRREPGTILEH